MLFWILAFSNIAQDLRKKAKEASISVHLWQQSEHIIQKSAIAPAFMDSAAA